MAITTAFCTSAKVDLLAARHNFLLSGGDAFKLALYTSAATLGATTTAYSATNEAAVSGGTGYTAGGGTLTRVDPTSSGTTAFTDFADLVFTLSEVTPTVTLTANGCLIYNDTLTTPVADASFSVHAFGGDATATGDGATFTIQMPAADATNAIIRLA